MYSVHRRSPVTYSRRSHRQAGGVPRSHRHAEDVSSSQSSPWLQNQLYLPPSQSRLQSGGLLQLPHELLSEVSRYLLPADLLGLYRTNRQLRSTLECDSVIWKSCLNAINGVPDCPSWISLPHFAALWFDTYCERCKSPDAPTEVIWQIPARYCIDCKYSCLTVQDPIDSFPEGPYLEKYVNHMDSVIPVVRRCENSPILYYSPHILAVTHELEKASTDRDRNAVMVRRQTRLADCCMLAGSYQNWRTFLMKRSRRSAVEVRLDKRKEIIRRLKDCGFESDLLDLNFDLRKLPHGIRVSVDRALPLSELEWRRISPKIRAFFQRRRLRKQNLKSCASTATNQLAVCHATSRQKYKSYNMSQPHHDFDTVVRR